jgi:flagellar biogenesis protein FliO
MRPPARRRPVLAVLAIALAALVNGLTLRPARAEGATPTAASAAPSAAAPTSSGSAAATAEAAPPSDAPRPLQLRPSKPLETAPESSGMSLSSKLLLALFVAAMSFVVLRRRTILATLRGEVSAVPRLRVVARSSIGLRTELLIVEADGQRLLLGVTPTSVRTLSVLTDDASEADGAVEGDGAVEADAPVQLVPRPRGFGVSSASIEPARDDDFDPPVSARSAGRELAVRAEQASASRLERAPRMAPPTVEQSLAKLIASARGDVASVREEVDELARSRRSLEPRAAASRAVEPSARGGEPAAPSASTKRPRRGDEGPLEGQVRGLGPRRGGS